MKTAKPLKVHLLFALFKVNHTVLLSTLGDSSYRFGATYVGLKQMGPAEVRCSEVTVIPSCEEFIFSLCVSCDVNALLLLVQFFPVMLGDMDNSGSLNAQIIHQITSRIRSKVAFQVEQ